MMPGLPSYFELEDASSRDRACLGPAHWRTTRDRTVLKRVLLSMCLGLVFVVVCASTSLIGPRIGPSDWVSFGRASARPRMTIFQHFNLHNDRIHKLQTLSMSHHQRYARFWGYEYRSSSAQYVSEVNTTVRQRQMNKVYALLHTVQDELALGDNGADWIHITDADVLIADPSVPLHALLPGDDDDGRRDDDVLIVGSEDGNGFNSGNMLYRCNLQLVAYLAHVIAISDDISKEYDHVMATVEDGKEPDDIETPPSDQRALCLVLEQNESFSSRFFHYPQRWLNSYDLYRKDAIQLHTHLVAGRKYRAEYGEYEEAEQRGWEWIRSRTSVELQERVQEVQTMAREYWKTAKIGLPKCIWV